MKQFFQKLLQILATIILSLTGSFHWSPPRWLRILFGILIWPLRPRKLNFAVLALLIAGGYGAWWYKHLPEPHKITFSVTRPKPTSLEKDSTPYPLIVTFSGSAASIDKVGKDVGKGISLSPFVSGTWHWNTDAELTFYPSNDWEVGKTYSVNLDKSLFAPQVLLKERSFSFDTPYFVPEVKSGEFYEDPTDPKIKQVVVSLKFTHPVDKSSLEKHIAVKMRVDPVKSFDEAGVKPMNFKVLYNENASEAYIRSEQVSIPDRDGEVLVTVDPGVLSVKGGKPAEIKLARTVQVPGVENYFKVTDVGATTVTNKSTYQAERVITIETTAAVSQKELAAKTEFFLLSKDPELYKGLVDTTYGSSEEEAATDENGDENSYSEEGDSEGGEGEEGGDDSNITNTVNCPLDSAAQVSAKILEKAEKLPVQWIPTEQEYSQLQSAKFSAPEGRCIYVRIKKGTKSFGDYPLIADRSFLTDAKPFTPDIHIIGEGAILSASGEKKLSIMTRNVEALRYRLFRILPNALHHLTTQTYSYGPYANPEFNYNFGPEQISEVFTSNTTIPPGEPGTPRYAAFDFAPYLASAPAAPKGLFIFEAAGWDPVRKTRSGPTSKRLVLLTDLGFVIKETQFGTRDIFVTSLHQGGGIAGADVSILGKNGLPIFSGKSDENGHLLVPSLKEFQFEKQPTVYVVQKDGDLSFMPYERRDRELNLSRFDIGGLYTQKEQESLQAYLFSDRGIYRPGETAHIGLILKNTDWGKLPAGVPFELTVFDSRGIEIKKSSIKFGPDGFTEFTYPVSEDALTGTYQLELSLARPKKSRVLIGSASIRVDEFVPDRLKIDAKFSEAQTNQSWYAPDGLKTEVTLRNLYGTAAEGNTIRGSIRLSPTLPYFQGFRDYTFFDPFKGKNSFNETIGDQVTDAEGKVTFDLNLNRFEKAIYQLSFISEGFEKDSGRSVVTNLSTIINPLPYLIGYKTDGDKSFIKRGSKINLELLAINNNLKKAEAKGLTLELIEKKYVSVLTRLENGNLGYQSVEKKSALSSAPLAIPANGMTMQFPSNEPGNYVYLLKDASGLILSEINFAVVGDANVTRNLERNAELKLKLDRDQYASGDEIQIEVQAPYTGAGLITIERDKVFTWKWFTTTTTSSIQTIKVPEGLEGNGYVHVAFVRSIDSPEVYMSPLSYGVEPFGIGKAKRTEALTLSVPKQVTPGETLKIGIATKDAARTAVFAVDEGILQVARYKKPDPLSHFFRKRALEVSTTQILDLLLPEFQILQNLASTGGDEDALMGRHRNPFKRKGQKPVVFWSGIIATGPQSKTVDVPTPDYFNGSVKVFAVSVTQGAIGVAEDAVTVQGDVVLTPNVPLAASPGDQFEVSTVVANLRGTSPQTEVSLELDKGLSVVGDLKKNVNIAKGKDAVVNFTLKATEVLGPSNVRFKAVNGAKTATYTLDMSVRPSSPLLTSVKYGYIKAGLLGSKSVDVDLTSKLYPDFSDRGVSASTLPLGLAQGLSRYLEKYPYGCSEQIASQAYPDLVFLTRHDLGVTEADARKSIEKSLTILAARQNGDGSFKLWPGYDATMYLSIHIIRLLMEARALGIDVNQGMYDNSRSFLQSIANTPVNVLADARNQAYAIYLLTKNGEVTTSYLDALKGAVERMTDGKWKKDITSLFMASTYKLLNMDKEADQFQATVEAVETTPGVISYHEDSLSHTAQYLYLMSRHFSEKMKSVKPDFLEKISNDLLSSNYNTLSAALLILGLNEYQQVAGTPESAGLLIQATTDGTNFNPLSMASGLFPRTKLALDLTKIKFTGSEKTPVFYSVEETGFDRGTPSQIQQGIEIIREYRNAKGEIISEANIGDDIEVRILLRAIEDPQVIGEVAVSDLFPAGFELQGGSLALATPASKYGSMSWRPQFTDAREDRALLFGTLDKQVAEYTYKVKAVSRGTFIVPPIQVDAMYNQRFAARNASSQFIIH